MKNYCQNLKLLEGQLIFVIVLFCAPVFSQTDQAISYISISYMCKGDTPCKSKDGVDARNYEGDSWCIENNHPTKSISFKHDQSIEEYENGKLTKVFPEDGDGYWNVILPGKKFIVSCKRYEASGQGSRYVQKFGEPVILKAHFD